MFNAIRKNPNEEVEKEMEIIKKAIPTKKGHHLIVDISKKNVKLAVKKVVQSNRKIQKEYFIDKNSCILYIKNEQNGIIQKFNNILKKF